MDREREANAEVRKLRKIGLAFFDREVHENLYEQAKRKVEANPNLAPHADFILADWPQGDEHWTWVIQASEAEILDWVAAGQ